MCRYQGDAVMARKLTSISVPILVAFALLFLLLREARSELTLGSSYLTWSDSPRVLTAVGNHQLLLWEKSIYVIGGSLNDDDPYHDDPSDKVFRSSIQPDGRLGNWISLTNTSFPALKVGAGDVSHNGWMYITGGHNGRNFVGATYYGIEDEPNVIDWQVSGYQFAARGLHATVIVKEGEREEIYVIGGLGFSDPEDNSVVYTTLNPDTGELEGAWTKTEPLLPQRFAHAAVTYKGWIYVIGGTTIQNDGQHKTRSVKYARARHGIQETWNDGEPLPEELGALSELRAVVTNDGRIFILGGRNDNYISKKVYSATIDTQTGQISPWQPVPELELPLESGIHSHAAVFAPNGSIYVVGGQDNNFKRGVNNHYIDTAFHIPVLSLTKSSDPTGPVHEGDLITYTISYANTSLITQTITISDPLPFNLTLVPSSPNPPADKAEPHSVVWNIGDVSPGGSGQVSFQARVALLPSLHQAEIGAAGAPDGDQLAYVLPMPIACDTTRFWALGVTHQSLDPSPQTLEVVIPPGATPSAMWLAVKGDGDIFLTVDGSQAERVATSNNDVGASLWSSRITTDAVDSGSITVFTNSPRRLNAIFLFDQDDPPFDMAALDDFYGTTKTFTYKLELPSVATRTMDVIVPFMDITYWRDQDLLPDTRVTEVRVEFDDQEHTVVASDPNLGNGLLMTQFPFTINPFSDTITSTKVLTVTVDTEDSVSTLGPRVCRPVLVENTAWLCSQQAGCISDTVTNIPEGFMPPTAGDLYLPIIYKTSP